MLLEQIVWIHAQQEHIQMDILVLIVVQLIHHVWNVLVQVLAQNVRVANSFLVAQHAWVRVQFMPTGLSVWRHAPQGPI